MKSEILIYKFGKALSFNPKVSLEFFMDQQFLSSEPFGRSGMHAPEGIL